MDWLRIPMRGYEAKPPVMPAGVWVCYESPCGVMSQQCGLARCSIDWLRIPMRGYEYPNICRFLNKQFVTNPHAGL